MIRAIVVLGLLSGLCACVGQAPEPVIKTVTVNLPTPVSCVPAGSPAPPVYADTPEALRAAADYAERYSLLAGEKAKHQAREAYLETLRSTCMKIAP